MQLELRPPAPRILALCVPELPLQRALRERGRADSTRERPPLAVVDDGRVLHCDLQARAVGVRPGDSAVQAQAACGALVTVPRDPSGDLVALQALAEAMLALAPVVEVAAPDALLADASAAHLLCGGRRGEGEALLAERARALAAELGYRCRVLIASGRGPGLVLARHGQAAPAATTAIPPLDIARILAPLPISALPLPPQVAERLAALGLRDVGSLARLPLETLAHRFGAPGLAAARLARGEDDTPLSPYAPEALPEEGLDLDGPVETTEPLLFALRRLAERVAARLQGRGLGATRLVVALGLDLADRRDPVERLVVPLARPTSAPASWLLPLRERLAALQLPAPVTAIRLAATEVAPARVEQLAIGDRPEALAALEAVLTRLASRLGERAAFAAETADRHRPEAAYRARPFLAAKVKRGTAAGANGRAARPPPRPTRLLATPRPLLAEGEGGRVTAVRLDGRAHPVLEMDGPERLCGEWWSDPFDRDYYRAHLGGLGACWIYRDGGTGRLYLHGFFD